MDLSFLCDNLLLIVPASSKEKIIEEISKNTQFYSIKIIDENDLKQNLCFSYDMHAVDYLYQKLSLQPNIIMEYLQSMYYVEDKIYQSKKLNQIRDLKKELFKLNLLKVNSHFYNNCKTKIIKVFGFDYINKSFKKLLDLLPNSYQLITLNQTQQIYEITNYATQEEEIDGVCYQISDLLHQNIDINQIKLANVSENDFFTLKHYFKMYNIPLDLNEKTCIYNLLCVKDFYQYCLKNNSLKDGLDYFFNTYPKESQIYQILLSFCNSLYFIDVKKSQLLFLNELKNTYINDSLINNCVQTISLNHMIFDNEYVFVIGVSQNIYPKLYKDDDFLSDLEKKELNIDTSDDLNYFSKLAFKKLLCKSDKIKLSFKEKSPFEIYSKVFNLNELNILENTFKKNRLISYSMQCDQYDLAKAYDNLYQENTDENIDILYSNQSIKYKNFKHVYTPISPSKIKKYLDNKKINLSFSAIDNFYKCKFKYYLSNFLKIEEYIENINAEIGNFFHFLLEKSFKENFNFNQLYEEEFNKIENYELKAHLKRNKQIMQDIIQLNQQRFNESALKTVETEKEFKISLNDSLTSTLFVGRVDLLLSTMIDNKTYVSIIDYKTYAPTLNLDNIQYGLSMQLPIYAYLIKNSLEYENINFCGFYFQPILPKNISYGTDYYQELINQSKLIGYSNSSLITLSYFDPHYSDSSLIKSMKYKDGKFSKNAKVLDDNEINTYIDMVKYNINLAFNEISEGHFDINPKTLKGKNISCENCSFKDICFMDEQDLINLDNSEMEDE